MNQDTEGRHVVHDASLTLPPPVADTPPMMFRPGSAPVDIGFDASFTLASPRVEALGGAAGIRSVVVDGFPAARDLIVPDATVAGVEISPLGLERRIRILDHAIMERTHLLEDRACVIVEWSLLDAGNDSVAAGEPVRIHVDWRIGPRDMIPPHDSPAPGPPPGERIALRWHRDATRLRAEFQDADLAICFAASQWAHLTAALHAETAIDCSLDAPLLPGRTLRLIITAGSGDDVKAATLPVPDPAGRILARNAVLDRRQREHIRLTSPDTDADRAVSWALHRIDWSANPDSGNALAALIAGEFALSRKAVTTGAGRQSPEGAIPAPATPGRPASVADATALWLMLVARHLAWTGELALAHAVWPRVRLAVDFLTSTANLQVEAGAFAELAMAAESVGDTDAVRAVEVLRNRERAAAPGADRRIPFPAARIVATTGDPHLAAEPLHIVVEKLLGAAPDAVRGRLRLRPAPPAGWDQFRIACLRMGEATITVGYRRDGSRHHWSLDQLSGAVPVRVAFEPVLAGRAVVSSSVDGHPASLVPRPHPGGLIVPVQLVLDHERSLVLELAD